MSLVGLTHVLAAERGAQRSPRKRSGWGGAGNKDVARTRPQFG